MSSSARSLRERAAAEIELRRRARLLPFDDWLPAVTPTWRWDWPHLTYMRAQLGRLRRREIDRLWMFCPPRHGKTEQNTVRFAAHWIECDPTSRVIIWAYNQTLAEKFSRKVRRIVTARGVPLNPERNAAGEWETGAGGGLRAAGVGVGITGMGADLILIDDPVKNRAEAESQAYRDRVHESYTDDLLTRAEPGCLIAGTMTRWHEDDLAGRILASEEGADWHVENLPALAEEDDPLGRAPGEALCPDRYPVEVLEQRKRVLHRTFYALFQGRPRPAEGNKFRRAWFRYWRIDGNGEDQLYRLIDQDGRTVRLVRSRNCRRFGTVDLASSKRTSADYSVVASWAVTPESDLLLIDLVRDRLEEPDLLRAARAAYRRNGLSYLSVESNFLGLGVVQTLRRGGRDAETGEYLPGLAVRGIPSLTDKVSRASTAIVRCESGQIYFPERAPWLADYEAELLAFDNGAHDDQVDVTSMAADDVFWQGSAPESGDLRAAREQAEALLESERFEETRRDPDNPRWWGDSE